MKKRNIKLAVKIFLLCLIIAGFSYGVKIIFFPDEEAKIRKTISMTVEELERKDIINFIRHFTLDYRDCFDNTYGTLYIFLKNNIDMFKHLDIRLSQMEIEIEKPQASIKFFARATLITKDGEVYKEGGRFILKMRKEDFKWKIYRLDEMEYDFD
ncbi:MAG: hypothetical protein NC906_08825 [Candidatus Omnitrophica bacterium]|nr:hypothetical protein [Candidatus Omnitrophota bacterium]MCM8815993.1 hypothetical protein [Candidatus Omnitrophota bacterium]